MYYLKSTILIIIQFLDYEYVPIIIGSSTYKQIVPFLFLKSNKKDDYKKGVKTCNICEHTYVKVRDGYVYTLSNKLAQKGSSKFRNRGQKIFHEEKGFKIPRVANLTS